MVPSSLWAEGYVSVRDRLGATAGIIRELTDSESHGCPSPSSDPYKQGLSDAGSAHLSEHIDLHLFRVQAQYFPVVCAERGDVYARGCEQRRGAKEGDAYQRTFKETCGLGERRVQFYAVGPFGRRRRELVAHGDWGSSHSCPAGVVLLGR